jgi:hypothetical protein
MVPYFPWYNNIRPFNVWFVRIFSRMNDSIIVDGGYYTAE